MKTVTLNVDGISQGQWSTFLLELNLMKKAWRSYGVSALPLVLLSIPTNLYWFTTAINLKRNF